MRSASYLFFTLFAFIACSSEEECINEDEIIPQAACTRQYDPVCGCNNITYGNQCVAENSGVKSWEAGECPDK